MSHVFGTGAGFGTGHADSGASMASAPPRLGQPANNAAVTLPPFGQSTTFSPGDCHYFLMGACAKGDNCPFRHSQAAKASGVVCRFWQNGFCKDTAGCSFQHPATGGRGHGRGGMAGRFANGRGMGSGRGAFGGGRGGPRPSAWETMDRSKQLCVFFAQGKCTKGEACSFSHFFPGERSVNPSPTLGEVSHAAGSAEATARPVDMQPFSQMPAEGNGDVVSPEGNGSGRGMAGFVGRDTGVDLGSSSRPQELGASGHRPGEFRPQPMSSEGSNFVSQDGSPCARRADGSASSTRTLQEAPAPTSGPSRVRPAVQGQARHEQGTNAAHGTQETMRAPVSSQAQDKPAGKSGIIALPNGGFVTRKRAAEMRLLGDDRGKGELRRVRQRDSRDQHVPDQTHRSLTAESRTAGAVGARISIMDRLGPAKQRNGKTTDRGSLSHHAPHHAMPVPPHQTPASTGANQVPGPAGLRAGGAGPPQRTREEPHQHPAPTDRSGNGPKIGPPSLISSQPLATSRSTRRVEDTVRQVPAVGKATTARADVPQRKGPKLDFEVPTLDEIRSKKRRAEAARNGATAPTKGVVPLAHRGDIESSTRDKTTRTTGAPAPWNKDTRARAAAPAPAATPVQVDTSNPRLGADSAAPATNGVTPPPSEVPPVLSDPPQLDAEDMDEFSAWL